MTSSQTKTAFSEPDVLQGLSLLTGGDYSDREWDGLVELRSKHDGRMFQEWYPYYSHDMLMEFVKIHSGKGNVYVGRNPRSAMFGSAMYIDDVFNVSLDIDPIRSTSPEDAASDAEIALAAKAAEVVEAAIKAKYCATPITVFTGNGFQLWYKLDSAVDVRGRRRWWELGQKAWESEQRALLPVGVKMDTQWDLPRVIKLPGTLSMKGNDTPERPRRMAKIIDHYWVGFPSECILKLCGNELDEASKDFQDLKPSGTVPDRFWKLLAGNGQLRGAWTGTLQLPDSSPSAQDMALAARLKMHKFTPEEAMAILGLSPGGNPDKRTREDYLQLTIQKAYRL